MPVIRLSLAFAAMLVASGPALAAVPSVAVDVAPLHSIVARVMQGVGMPALLLPPGASPHGYALRPSDAARLQAAEVVFWIGPELTPWLAKPLAALASGARVEAMAEAPSVERLPVRTGGPFEMEDEGELQEHAADAHLWLDPQNATAFAAEAAATLAELDPENAALYRANAAAFGNEMRALTQEIATELASVRGEPFIVFHDAYRYFEHRFDLPAAGSIALQEGVAPGAARLAEIRDRMREGGIVCAFAEPQFRPALLATAIEGSDVRLGTLDPIGAGLEPGPNLYPALLRTMTASLTACLGGG